MTEERYRVQSVERAFALLEALAEAGPEGMTLSNLARLLGVSKSTAYAILQTLLAGGFVADAGRRACRAATASGWRWHGSATSSSRRSRCAMSRCP